MKSRGIAGLLAAMAFAFPVTSYAADYDWTGTYTSKATNFITVKRVTITRQKDGSLKIHGVLVGFPDEVSLGDTTAELYAERDNKPKPDVMLASFKSERYKPTMVIRPNTLDKNHLTGIQVTCYLNDADGTPIHVTGLLSRQP